MTLRVVELFAGIGAQAQALENLGLDFTSTVRKTGRTFCHPDDMSTRIHEAPVKNCNAYQSNHVTLDRWFA